MEESQVKVNLSATNFVIGIIVGHLANHAEADDTGNPPVLDLASTSAHRAAQHTLEWIQSQEAPLVPDFEIIRTPPYWYSPVWRQAVDTASIRFGLLHKHNQYEYRIALSPSVIDRYWDYLPGKRRVWQGAARRYVEFLRSNHERYHSQ